MDADNQTYGYPIGGVRPPGPFVVWLAAEWRSRGHAAAGEGRFVGRNWVRGYRVASGFVWFGLVVTYGFVW